MAEPAEGPYLAPMNAVDLLTGHHRELEARFDAMKKAPRVDQRAFDEVADALAAHVAVEEEIFYPAVKAERTEDILLESLEEHLSIKRVLADLVGLTVDDEKFGPKLHVLAEQAEHHHEEEEEHLFPKVRALFEERRLAELGLRMKARMDELAAHAARCRIPAQTADSATI